MPPIHPAIVHFPIALTIFAAVLGTLAYVRGSSSMGEAGWWSIVGALLTAIAAAAAGYWDMERASLGSVHQYVEMHMSIGLAITASLIVLFAWQVIRRRSHKAIGAPYLTVLWLAAGLTALQGWLGGEMVYSQGAGVAIAGRGTEPASAGQERLEAVTGLLSWMRLAHGEKAQKDGADTAASHTDDAQGHSKDGSHVQ